MVQVFVPSRNLLRAPPMRRVVEKDEAAQIQQRVDAMKCAHILTHTYLQTFTHTHTHTG